MKNLIERTLTFLMTLILTAGLAKGAVYDFTEGNRLSLIHDAIEGSELKLDLVRKAKHHIHIATYYWDDIGFPVELMNELKKAHARGVDVRLLTTWIPSVTLDFTNKAGRILNVDHSRKESSAKLAFLKLTPGLNLSWTNSIHEKIFLVDGKVAILGGRNISNNDQRAKDLEIKLEGPVVNEVQEHFRKLFNFLIDRKILNHCSKNNIENPYQTCFDSYNDLRFSGNDLNFYPVNQPFENGSKARILTNEVLFSQFKHNYKGEEKFSINDDIINTIINTDYKELRAYNYYVIPTTPYKAFLENGIQAKKDIRMISNSLKSAAAISNKGYLVSLPGMKNLVDQGLNLVQWTGGNFEYLHEKVMLFDEDHGFIGSHNFGLGSTSVSSEICVEFYDRQIVSTLNNIFDREFEDRSITTKATTESLQKEMNEHKKMIRFFKSTPMGNILKMLY